MDLSIIIVNWKSREFLNKCLATVYATPLDLSFEVIVIDAGSFDGCDEMLKQCYPSVRFLQAGTNLGFAQANNRAFLISTGRTILFLNPDTEVLGKAIETLFVTLLSEQNVGAVGAMLLNTDGSLQTSCIQAFPTITNQLFDSDALRRRWPKAKAWGMEALFVEGRRTSVVEAISGACLMVKRDAFIEAGMFNENYFMYSEDIDLSYEISRLGYKNAYVPGAVVVHHGGGSSGKAVSHFAAVMLREAIWKFLRKTRGRWYASMYRTAMLAASVVRIVFLALLWPVRTMQKKLGHWKNSLGKWRSILLWSVCRHRVLAKFK